MQYRAFVQAVFFVASAAMGWAADGVAMPASKPDVRRQVIEVVEAQLAALRAQDPAKAYGYVSAGLRAQMPVAVFAAIVRESYPELWTNTRAEYGIVRDNDVRATVMVHVFSQQREASFDYTLEKERGRWRVRAILRHQPEPGTEM